MPKRTMLQKVLVIGSGPITIGQAAEFDYAGTQACLALKEEGVHVVLVNNNPATIMTDEGVADTLYLEPLTVESVTAIIARERPDGLIASTGGQTGLNLALGLAKSGVLDQYEVELLGTPLASIEKSENREQFKREMLRIGEPVPESTAARNVGDAERFAAEIGFPLIVRPAFTLGGAGGGTAANREELQQLVRRGIQMSPIQQVLVEQSIKGWKEIEYEVIRDANDTCIVVCTMENVDPVGIHTGDSIVVAPVQTMSYAQEQMLRHAAVKVIRTLGVVGGCNIQFGFNPATSQYAIIEVNPRVSRSSALASKATGYPIARVAAKLALGYRLDEVVNPLTGATDGSTEPVLDYVVVKLPRWPFDKFPQGDRQLGTQMKATGEVMALDRNFEGALMKAIRSLDTGRYGLLEAGTDSLSDAALRRRLAQADDERLFLLGEAFARGWSLDDVHDLTLIDPFFLFKVERLVRLERQLAATPWKELPQELLHEAKRYAFCDTHLATLCGVPVDTVRARWQQWGWQPAFKSVDSCAAQYAAQSPYFYATWDGVDEVVVTGTTKAIEAAPAANGGDATGAKDEDAANAADVAFVESAAAVGAESKRQKKVLVVGSGPIRIGQGIEFDYCSVHGVKALQQLGVRAVVVNNNPETVSTDYVTADRLYFEPLTIDDVLAVAEKERVDSVIVQYGGQTAIQLTTALEANGLTVLGTSAETIARVEDREQFYTMLRQLAIPHIVGETAACAADVLPIAAELGYPLLVRPSYVIGGQGMQIVHSEGQLRHLLQRESYQPSAYPLLCDRYVEGEEIEIDVVTDGCDVAIPLFIRQVEKAGVHSGDSIAFFGAEGIAESVQRDIVTYTENIARALQHKGVLNIQFVVDGDTVYVLEVNARASRTVPLVSKVTGYPILLWATRVQLGEKLADFAPCGLLKEPRGFAVKAPVFSAEKLRGIDAAPSPNMRSTGEVIGLGATPEEAFGKAVPEVRALWDGDGATGVLFSVCDSKKAALVPFAQQLHDRGVPLFATAGTATALRAHGLKVTACSLEEALGHIAAARIRAVVNVPTQGGEADRAGFRLREQCLLHGVPLFYSLETLAWSLRVPQEQTAPRVSSLAQFRANA